MCRKMGVEDDMQAYHNLLTPKATFKTALQSLRKGPRDIVMTTNAAARLWRRGHAGQPWIEEELMRKLSWFSFFSFRSISHF